MPQEITRNHLPGRKGEVLSKAVFSKLGELIKAQIAGLHPQNFLFNWCRA